MVVGSIISIIFTYYCDEKKRNKVKISVCREQQLRQFYNKTASEHLCVKA